MSTALLGSPETVTKLLRIISIRELLKDDAFETTPEGKRKRIKVVTIEGAPNLGEAEFDAVKENDIWGIADFVGVGVKGRVHKQGGRADGIVHAENITLGSHDEVDNVAFDEGCGVEEFKDKGESGDDVDDAELKEDLDEFDELEKDEFK